MGFRPVRAVTDTVEIDRFKNATATFDFVEKTRYSNAFGQLANHNKYGVVPIDAFLLYDNTIEDDGTKYLLYCYQDFVNAIDTKDNPLVCVMNDDDTLFRLTRYWRIEWSSNITIPYGSEVTDVKYVDIDADGHKDIVFEADASVNGGPLERGIFAFVWDPEYENPVAQTPYRGKI